MAEYTPPTDRVRERYARCEPPHRPSEFDRWLAEYRRQVIEECAAVVGGVPQRDYSLSAILDVSAHAHAEALRSDIAAAIADVLA